MKLRILAAIVIIIVLCYALSGCGIAQGALRDTAYVLGGASELAADMAENVSTQPPKRYR